MASSSDIRAGGAFIELFTKDAKMRAGLMAAQARLRAFGAGSMAMGGKLMRAFTHPAVALGGMALAAVGLAGGMHLIGTAFEKAAEHETFGMQLEVLMGSATAARHRLHDLTEFAAKTPFELPEVVKANKVLHVMTGGVLATNAGLRMVGDTAALTGADFERVAYWVGTAYDRLHAGRPTGAALMSLTRMGAISGVVRNQIEALAKSGKGAEAWTVLQTALGKYAGGMDKLSQTTTGLFSTLKDSIGLTLAAFAEPMLGPLKEAMRMMIMLFDDILKPKAHSFGAAIGESFRTAFDVIAGAFVSGRLGDLIEVTLQLAFSGAVDYLVAGIQAAIEILKMELTSVTFWSLVGTLFKGAMKLTPGAIISEAALAAGKSAAGVPEKAMTAAEIMGKWMGGALSKGTKDLAARQAELAGEVMAAGKVIREEFGAGPDPELARRMGADKAMVKEVKAAAAAQAEMLAAGGAFGTFSGAMADRMGAGGPMGDIKKATERTADGVEELNERVEDLEGSVE